jgi:thiamine monophosphate synthase
MKTKNLKEVFVYLDSINEFIKFNILKIINVNIIYDNYDFSKKIFLDIKNFCKKYNLNLFIKDNYKAAIKFKLAGIVITHTNKKILGYGNPFCNKKKIEIIGKVHNQKEFFLKKQQKCEKIIFSPIFDTKKYSSNQILNINKFNLISKKWNVKIFALGGINLKNISQLRMLNINGFAVKSFVLDPNIKNSFKLIHYLK